MTGDAGGKMGGGGGVGVQKMIHGRRGKAGVSGNVLSVLLRV